MLGAVWAPAFAGTHPTPTWGDDDRVSATRVGGTWFVFWPEARDDGELSEYQVFVRGDLYVRVNAQTRMAMVISNVEPEGITVVAIDGAGLVSAPLGVSGQVEPFVDPLPRLSIRVIEQIGVDGGLSSTDSRHDSDGGDPQVTGPTLPTIPDVPPDTGGPGSTAPPASTVPDTSVGGGGVTTTDPSSTGSTSGTPSATTAPSTSGPSTTVPASTFPSTTTPPTSVPPVGGDGAECIDSVVVGQIPQLSRGRRTFGPVPVRITPGRYRVTAISRDPSHGPGVSVQLSERWSVSSPTGWSLPPTPDLPTADTYAEFDLGETLITQEISTLTFAWAGSMESANSVAPELRLRCVDVQVEAPGISALPDTTDQSLPVPIQILDSDDDGIVDDLDRWPFEGALLDASRVASSAFVVGRHIGRVDPSDRAAVTVAPSDDLAVRLFTRGADQLVDAVLCSEALVGGHRVSLYGDVDAVVSCDPLRIEVFDGVVSVALGDGRRLDVPAGSTLYGGTLDTGGINWWTSAGSAAILRGDATETFRASSAQPMVVPPPVF